jgi:hypothetical protein
MHWPESKVEPSLSASSQRKNKRSILASSAEAFPEVEWDQSMTQGFPSPAIMALGESEVAVAKLLVPRYGLQLDVVVLTCR